MTDSASFLSGVFAYPARESLLLECPALLTMCYQHVAGALGTGLSVRDPFANSEASHQYDAVGELLAVTSMEDLLGRVFGQNCTSSNGTSSSSKFWEALREALQVAWDPSPESASSAVVVSSSPLLLHYVGGKPRFVLPGLSLQSIELATTSLHNALEASRRFLRSITACALAGSCASLTGSRQQELVAIMQLARLVPQTTANVGEVTAEGLNFCMMSLQQQWWTLVSATVDRVLAVTRALGRAGGGTAVVTKPLLWQLLSVIAMQNTSQHMLVFPSKDEDVAAYYLLARLAEIGLVYPIQKNGQRCFVVSPHYQHALEWQATAPLCLSSILASSSSASSTSEQVVRREDTDTIITETNFRLYAYTRSPDLLAILDKFARREEQVSEVLVCYRVTRDSFAEALSKGLSAGQILRFLSLKAHPSMLRQYGESAHVGEVGDGEGAAAARSSSASSHGARGKAAAAATEALAIPQSFCDQLLMWESECRRVIFQKHVVLLRNMTAEQQDAVRAYLSEAGEADAVVHCEPGYMVVREEVYERLLAQAVPEV